jgi:hypothetical protein
MPQSLPEPIGLMRKPNLIALPFDRHPDAGSRSSQGRGRRSRIEDRYDGRVHGVLSEGYPGMHEGPWATGDAEHSGLRARGEEALGELAQAVLENPLLSQAVGKALDAGERAAQAQRSAIGALNLASAADLERLERRLRSLSDRLEAVEDQLDELAAHGPGGGGA